MPIRNDHPVRAAVEAMGAVSASLPADADAPRSAVGYYGLPSSAGLKLQVVTADLTSHRSSMARYLKDIIDAVQLKPGDAEGTEHASPDLLAGLPCDTHAGADGPHQVLARNPSPCAQMEHDEGSAFWPAASDDMEAPVQSSQPNENEPEPRNPSEDDDGEQDATSGERAEAKSTAAEPPTHGRKPNNIFNKSMVRARCADRPPDEPSVPTERTIP